MCLESLYDGLALRCFDEYLRQRDLLYEGTSPFSSAHSNLQCFRAGRTRRTSEILQCDAKAGRARRATDVQFGALGHGRECIRNIGHAGCEKADRIGALIGARYYWTNSITVGLDYRFLWKDSNLEGGDYYQNLVFLSVYYKF